MSLFFVVSAVVVNVVICSCCCQCCIPVDCYILLLSSLLSHCCLLLPLFLLLSSLRPCLLPRRRSLMPGAAQGRQQWTHWQANDDHPNPTLGEEALPLAGCPKWWGAGCPSRYWSLVGAATGRGAQRPLLQGNVSPPRTRTLVAVPITMAPTTSRIFKFNNYKHH